MQIHVSALGVIDLLLFSLAFNSLKTDLDFGQLGFLTESPYKSIVQQLFPIDEFFKHSR